MNNRTSPRLVQWAGRLMMAALLSGGAGPLLAQDAKTSQFYEDALVRFEKKDFAGAIVQLKNVLKGDNKNLSAQVLLGRALLENGDINAAEVAFSEALRLGVNRAEVVVPLGRALINQGKPDEVLNSPRMAMDGLPKGTLQPLLLLRAAAAADLADLSAGLKAVEDARRLDPADAGSWLVEVPLRIRARQYKEALVAADKAVSLSPNSADAHYSRGEALHVVPNLVAALAAYNKAISLEPAHVGALVARAGIHMDQDRVDAAAKDLAELPKQGPRDPRGVYLKALIAERQGRSSEARDSLNELTAMLDPIPPQYMRYRPQLLMLGGMAHYSLGQREKAKPYLEGVLRGQAGHPMSKVLANIYIADGNVDSAIEILSSYIRGNPQDAQAMMLLASAHMAQGRHARAAQIMQDALKVSDQPGMRTALGLSLVGGGRYGDAIKELAAAFAKDPKQLQAGYALAAIYVQAGQAANALRVVEALNKTHPRNASVLNLLGTARRAKGELAGARTAFEAAAEADPGFVSAQVSLARLDIQGKAYSKAAERLNAAFAKDEKNLEVIIAIAELSERSHQLPEAQRWYAKGDEVAGPDNTAPALALVDFHLRHGQAGPAKEALKRAQSKSPDGLLTLLALARVSLANGDAATARTTLTRAANSAGYNPPLLTQIALLQIRAAAPQAAAYSLDKALGERPDYLPAQALRVDLDIRRGDLGKAELRARQVLNQYPKLGLGHALMGDLAMARNQRDAAIAAYRKAHELEKSTDSLMRVFSATAVREPAAAMRLADQWLVSKPGDAMVWRALGDTQLGAGNSAGARRSYEALIKLQPDNAEAMNNLTHALLAQKDPGALKMAERALTLAPTAAHVMGTAGWAAFKSGQPDRALQLLRDARLRDPDNPDTRYFLGSVLASAGRSGEAREELSAALKAQRGMSYRTDAERLLSTLR